MISIQTIWAFIALFIAAQMTSSPTHTIVACISICVPIWSFYGVLWVFDLKRLPLWTFFVFLLPYGISLLPFLIDPHDYDDNYMPFLIFITPIAFLIFRHIQNYNYPQKSIKAELAENIFSCRGFLKPRAKKLKRISICLFLLSLIIAILAFIDNAAQEASFERKINEIILKTSGGSIKRKDYNVDANDKFSSCLNALTYAVDNIERVNSQFNNKLAQGFRGKILLNNKSKTWLENEEFFTPTLLDFNNCKKFGISQEQILLLYYALNDNMPEDPLATLSECALGAYINAHYKNKTRNAETKLLSHSQIGEKIGEIIASLTYLYKDLEALDPVTLTLDFNDKVSAQYKNLLSITTSENYEDFIAPLIKKCDRFGLSQENE